MKRNANEVRYIVKVNGRKVEEGVGMISSVKYSAFLLSYPNDTYLQFFENGKEIASGWGMKEEVKNDN